jgi:hypothetical protein
MRKPRAPRCVLPKRPTAIDGRFDTRQLDHYCKALEAYSDCWRTNWKASATLVGALQSAVQVRENAADQALAAAKF